jgi:hypothetical protein
MLLVFAGCHLSCSRRDHEGVVSRTAHPRDPETEMSGAENNLSQSDGSIVAQLDNGGPHSRVHLNWRHCPRQSLQSHDWDSTSSSAGRRASSQEIREHLGDSRAPAPPIPAWSSSEDPQRGGARESPGPLSVPASRNELDCRRRGWGRYIEALRSLAVGQAFDGPTET